MQTLIRKFETGRYVGKDGHWTDDAHRARAFRTSLSARLYQAVHKLSDTQLIPAVEEAPSKRLLSTESRACAPISTHTSLGTVEVQVELGTRHDIYLRGEGAGLNWEHGVRLTRVGNNSWLWLNQQLREPVVFGILLDDQIWAKGEWHVVRPGEHLRIRPDFDWPEIPRMS